MAALIFHLSTALAMLILIAFSFYMLKNTKGRLSEGFKIIIIGHTPLLFLQIAEAAFIYYNYKNIDVISGELSLLEQTTQAIAALSIFIAIYLIKKTTFIRFGDTKND